MKPTENIKSIIQNTSLLKRFLEYVQVDTPSSHNSDQFPSTPQQKILGEILASHLKELGLKQVNMDENGYVYGFLPGTSSSAPKIGLIAHMDVSPEVKGEGVKPLIHKNYDGKPLNLPAGIEISSQEFPVLKNCLGHTIITSDGSTLLGADDKAGIAEIMTVLEILKESGVSNSMWLEVPENRPDIYICFTPDEEIGRGVNKINLEQIKADFAYTLDGGVPYEVNSETFNAFSAKVSFTGINTHPGTAKGIMVNALRHAARFVEMIPQKMSPEQTEEKEPYIHPDRISGKVEKASVEFLLRGFDFADIEYQKNLLQSTANYLMALEPRLKIDVKIEESYRNMKEKLDQYPAAFQAIIKTGKKLDVPLEIKPIRGGTDGARLSFMGLPTPNIFTGGCNFHSKQEFISLNNMALTVSFILHLLQVVAEENRQ